MSCIFQRREFSNHVFAILPYASLQNVNECVTFITPTCVEYPQSRVLTRLICKNRIHMGLLKTHIGASFIEKHASPRRIWRPHPSNWRQVEFSSFLGSPKSNFFQTPCGVRIPNHVGRLRDFVADNSNIGSCFLHHRVFFSTSAYIWNTPKHNMSCNYVALACVCVV
jgi:hypothetical protein